MTPVVNPEAGYSYRLKNKRTGLHLTSADFSAGTCATIYPSVASGQGRPAQTWNVLSPDNGGYLIEQKAGGTILTADDYSSGTVRINLDNPQNGTTNVSIRNSQIWVLCPEGTGYTLSNKNGGPSSPPTASTTETARSTSATGRPARTGLPDLGVGARNHLRPDRHGGGRPDRPGRRPVPVPAGYPKPNPETTPEVLIGTTALPSPLGVDPALGQARKAQESPYHLLKRYGFYKIVHCDDHSGPVHRVESRSATIGMSTTNAREVESTTGISVTAETAMGYEGFSASLSTTVGHQLRTRVATETTQANSTTVPVEREYLANGKRLAQSIWFRADRYVLERSAGHRLGTRLGRAVDDCTPAGKAAQGHGHATAWCPARDCGRPDLARMRPVGPWSNRTQGRGERRIEALHVTESPFRPC
ncbi:hypothetical protein [Streptomyces sp. NPDC058872]|uniref:hypothetical protein n=1 Tax=Streptomyces sp. NPDC058872 TaxID=3346661 RepID=UPI003682E99E